MEIGGTNPAIVLDNADDATMRRIFQVLFEAIFRKVGAAQAKLRWDAGMERNTDPEWLRTNFKADKQWVDEHIHSEKGKQGMLKLVLLGAQKYLTNGHQFSKVPPERIFLSCRGTWTRVTTDQFRHLVLQTC